MSQTVNKAERQAQTARMTKCQCGNVVRLGSLMCGRCIDREAKAADTEAMREILRACDHTLTLHGKIDRNTPLHERIQGLAYGKV